MSGLIRVQNGFRLDEHPPAEHNYSYRDEASAVTREVAAPIFISAFGDKWHGKFADLDNGQWRETRDFGLNNGYNSYSDTAPGAVFWSWADSSWHRISLRELSTDPDNPRLKTYDIYDSALGQIRPGFTADIGRFGNYTLPELGYDTDGVVLRGVNDARGCDYIARSVAVGLRYAIWNAAGTAIDHWYSETAYTYSGIDASVYPNLHSQTEIIHTVTGGEIT